MADLGLLDLLQFLVVLPVLAQHPVVVVALSLVLVLQLIVLLLQVIMLGLSSAHTRTHTYRKKKANFKNSQSVGDGLAWW